MTIPNTVPERDVAGSGLARHAGLTGAATLVSRVLGLVRDQVIAALFGAGDEMDAFVVAFRIPNLVRDLFAEGAMSAAFVPTFTAYLTRRGRADAWRLANNVLTMLTIITGIVVVAGIVFAAPLASMYARDYANVPGKLELTIRLTRVVLPFLTLVAIAAVAMGMLNSLHHYFVPALSPAMFNVATIVCAIALVPVMPAFGWPRIMAVAIGALVGGVGLVALQWPALRREGFRFRPVLDAGDPGLRRVLTLMGPGTIGIAATQVNLFVNTLLATSQGTGAVSWLTYAFRLMYLPIGLFGVSIGTAVLPAVSRHAAENDLSGIRTTIRRGLSMMLTVNIPATIGLIVLAVPIVELLFERGRFTAADTHATATALRMYAVGLVGYSAARITSPTFYALGRPRVPVIVSICSIAVNVVCSVALVRVMGFSGLALGTAIAAVVNSAALVWLLRGTLDGIEGRRLATTSLKVVAAAAVMAAVCAAIQHALERAVPGSELMARAARLSTSIGGGLVVLAIAGKLLRVEEVDDAIAMIHTRVRKLLTR
ncbi:MAG TPA: murein biosynthesis integral membrane protein MurJ [Vicinamibacterales bacterium]|nr:murein biosynthesis integral membrane protein MurJ [Vicinamibacterales bacterium]